MPWQILVFFSVITYSLSVILQRVIMKDEENDPVAFAILFQLFTGILILGAAVLNGFVMPDFSAKIINLILMVVLYGVANVLIFKSLQYIEASAFTILFTTRVLWTMLAAIYFLGEVISPALILGTVLIVAGVILATYEQGKLDIKNKGVILALLAGLSFGLAFANDAFMIRDSDLLSYVALAFIFPTFATAIIFPGSIKKIGQMVNINFLKKLSLLSIFYALSAITIFSAYKTGNNVAQISSLNQTSTILTVLLGVVVLKERKNMVLKIAGGIVAMVGMILVG